MLSQTLRKTYKQVKAKYNIFSEFMVHTQYWIFQFALGNFVDRYNSKWQTWSSKSRPQI